MTTARIEGAHLVGSAPVERPEEIFQLASEKLGAHLARLGDGEVGERDTWIRFQNKRLSASAQIIEAATDPAAADNLPAGYTLPPTWRLIDPEIDAADIELPDLGYAEAAISSYEIFGRKKVRGEIPSYVRFMVGLPSPLSVVTIYIHIASREKVLTAYAAKLMGELKRSLAAISAEELSIQWEIVFEIMMLEGHPLWRYFGDDLEAGIQRQFDAMVNAVPEPVELGFHLCYGDAGHKHFIEPQDAGNLTLLANLLCDVARRPVDFIHMPVPRGRSDRAYFAPLAGLALHPDTTLYLGLVHHIDGEAGTRRRIQAAAEVVSSFGISAECGLGRRPRETLVALLEQHQRIASGPMISRL